MNSDRLIPNELILAVEQQRPYADTLVIRRNLHRLYDGGDLVNSLILKWLRNPPEYMHNQAGYIRSCLRRAAIDLLRSGKSCPMESMEQDVDAADYGNEETDSNDLIASFYKAVEGNQEATFFLDFWLNDKSTTTYASENGISQRTAQRHLAKGMIDIDEISERLLVPILGREGYEKFKLDTEFVG